MIADGLNLFVGSWCQIAGFDAVLSMMQ